MSANNFLLKLIGNLYVQNRVLRNQIDERKSKSFTLQQELEQSQNSTKQFSKAYYDLHPTLCHLRATNNELKREYSLLKTKIDSIKECQICNEQFDHGMHQPAKATLGIFFTASHA